MSFPDPSPRPVSQVESNSIAPNTPPQDASLLEPPRVSYLEQTPESVGASSRGSFALHSGSNTLLTPHEKRFSEAYATPGHPDPAPSPTRKRSILARPIFWLIAILAFAVVVLAIILPVYFLVIKPHSSHSSSTSGGPSGTGGPGSSGNDLTTGGNGSRVTTSDGTTFTYINNFGGFCEFAYRFRDPISPWSCV